MPSAWDRLFASAFGVAAVCLVAANRFDMLVVWSSRSSIDVTVEDGISNHQVDEPDGPRVHTDRRLGIYLCCKAAE